MCGSEIYLLRQKKQIEDNPQSAAQPGRGQKIHVGPREVDSRREGVTGFVHWKECYTSGENSSRGSVSQLKAVPDQQCKRHSVCSKKREVSMRVSSEIVVVLRDPSRNVHQSRFPVSFQCKCIW